MRTDPPRKKIMFNFEEIEDGSEDRYHKRLRVWQGEEPFDPTLVSDTPNPQEININPRNLPKVRHYFWWVVHNLIAHPAIGFAPIKATFDFHDWTSRKLNGL